MVLEDPLIKSRGVCKKVGVDLEELHRKVRTLPCSEAVLSHHHFQPSCCCVMTAYVMRKSWIIMVCLSQAICRRYHSLCLMVVLVLLTSNDRVNLMTNSNNVAFKCDSSTHVFVATLWQSSTISAS